jgi:chromosome segregation ATPase
MSDPLDLIEQSCKKIVTKVQQSCVEVEDLKYDVANLMAELDAKTCELAKAHEELFTVQGDLLTTREDLAKVQGDLLTTRDDLAKVQGDLLTTRDDLAKVQGEMAALRIASEASLSQKCAEVRGLRAVIEAKDKCKARRSCVIA